MATAIINGRRVQVPDVITVEEIRKTSGIDKGHTVIRCNREGNFVVRPRGSFAIPIYVQSGHCTGRGRPAEAGVYTSPTPVGKAAISTLPKSFLKSHQRLLCPLMGLMVIITCHQRQIEARPADEQPDRGRLRKPFTHAGHCDPVI